ncbi:hypothetical protein G6F24_017799 [Rhizopus arrhizus]|nr:hypothetical protein G6F24_017799 [Rhizopus arrhizus]
MRGALSVAVSLVLLAGHAAAAPRPDYAGTTEPCASDAVYFVGTDRFVNGDPSNDHRDQGGTHRTFDIPVPCPDKVDGNIGYLGGDFRGCGSRRSSTTPMKPSPAASRSAAPAR